MPLDLSCLCDLDCFKDGVGDEGDTGPPPARPATATVTSQAAVAPVSRRPAKASDTRFSTAAEPSGGKTLQETLPESTLRVPSLPQQMWDRAYDELKDEEPELMEAYEGLLSRELLRDERSGGAEVNCVEQDPDARREQLGQLIDSSLERTKKAIAAMERANDTLQAVIKVTNMVATALQAMPQAALAWTGVCFALRVRFACWLYMGSTRLVRCG